LEEEQTPFPETRCSSSFRSRYQIHLIEEQQLLSRELCSFNLGELEVVGLRATNTKEAKDLIEAGFDFVCKIEKRNSIQEKEVD
jgi:hypothetical protein